jgi:hypothetical protein
VHTVAPAEGEYDPAGHASHPLEPLVEMVPALHSTHALDASLAEYDPAAHDAHAPTASLRPAPYVPAPHAAQSPMSTILNPAGQKIAVKYASSRYICPPVPSVMKLHTRLGPTFGCPKKVISLNHVLRLVVKSCTTV